MIHFFSSYLVMLLSNSISCFRMEDLLLVSMIYCHLKWLRSEVSSCRTMKKFPATKPILFFVLRQCFLGIKKVIQPTYLQVKIHLFTYIAYRDMYSSKCRHLPWVSDLQGTSLFTFIQLYDYLVCVL